ncbi:hypothetical protein M5689_012538 [Euphorbia peplus]|nr:hypothetical protein M5689_012538 [Euphorbia peplus]
MYIEDSDGIVRAREFDFSDKLFVVHEDEIRVCNSCNGLICFVIPWDQSILIWNPSFPTEYKIIQCQQIPDYEPYQPTAMVYDPASDDYKIVMFPVICDTDEVYISVSIFSLKSNSWRSKIISIKKSIDYLTFRLVYAKNRLYWIATDYCEEGKETDCIVYFDLAEESLDYMNLPSNSDISCRLINYKESIAIVRENFEGQRELWVLEDHCGMESSWNKIFSSNVTAPLLSSGDFSFPVNGDNLVLTWRGQFKKYDMKGGSSEHVEVQGDKIAYYRSYLSESPYVESLVSPRQL